MGKIDGKKILEKVEVPEDKGAYSFYISKALMKKFKKEIGKAPASKVVEELIKEFLESLGK